MHKLFITIIAAAATLSCTDGGAGYTVERYLCNFEGGYWDARVDSNPNGDNLVAGTIELSWRDEASGIAGEVTQPFPGFWEGAAISSHCAQELDTDDIHRIQLYAYTDDAYSGRNFLILNDFMGDGTELRFEQGSSFVESMMVANTTYSRIVTGNGYRMADRPLGDNESIWIVADGYINGSDEVVATSKFFLYEDGKPSFEGWKKWYLTSMCKVDRVVFRIEWNGTEQYNPYPAYFAVDDIVLVRHEAKE